MNKCPHCDKNLEANTPMEELAQHVKKQMDFHSTRIDTLEKRIAEAMEEDANRSVPYIHKEKRSAQKAAIKWKAWDEALTDLIKNHPS